MSLILSNASEQRSSLVTKTKFRSTLSADQISWQIANLLNQNNRLSKIHTVETIMTSTVEYFIELHSHKVIGCVGLLRNQNIDKILHLSVDAAYRNYGIGKKLLHSVLTNSNSDVLYMTVREDNLACLRLATVNGFIPVAYIPKMTYNILSLCLFRRK